MRKLIILTAVILCIGCLLGACTNNGNEENTVKTEEPTKDSTTESATEAETEAPKLEKLTVGGAELSEYTIIYARNSYYKVLSGIREQLKGDYDFDHLTAQRLADLIYERFGIRMTVAQDTKTEVGEKEILVGMTNRKLHPETQGTDNYTVSLTEGKLVVCGGAFGTTWHAIDAVEAWLTQKAQDHHRDLSSQNRCLHRRQHHLRRNFDQPAVPVLPGEHAAHPVARLPDYQLRAQRQDHAR